MEYDKTLNDVRLQVSSRKRAVITYTGPDYHTQHYLELQVKQLTNHAEAVQLIDEFEDHSLIGPDSLMQKCFPRYAEALTK